jgi:hypothetical protein
MYVAIAQMFCGSSGSSKRTAGVSVAIYCDLWRTDRIRTLVPFHHSFHHRVRHSQIHSYAPLIGAASTPSVGDSSKSASSSSRVPL